MTGRSIYSWICIFSYACMFSGGLRTRAQQETAAASNVVASVITETAPAPSERFPSDWYPPDNDVTYVPAPERGAPYRAVLVTTWHSVDPATGQLKTTLSQSTLKARDGAGRTRTEAETLPLDGRGGFTKVREVSIWDPVSHCSFRWVEPAEAAAADPRKPEASVDCQSRTIHFIPHSTESELATEKPRTGHSHEMDVLSEPLGTRKFGDISAVGMRRTRTMNDLVTGGTQKVVMEVWYSTDLKETLEMKEVPEANGKPRSGGSPDFELTKIERGEPDAELFYPPAGYAIRPGP